MNYEMFMKKVEEILDYMPEKYRDARVCIRKVWKNIGVMEGLTVYVPKGGKIAPLLYIEELYQVYQECRDLDAVLSHAAKVLAEGLESRPQKAPDIDLARLKENVVMTFINTAQNEEMLRHVPSRPFQDLSIVFRYLISYCEEGIQSLLVTNQLAQELGISEEELFCCAVENTKRIFPSKVFALPQNYAEKMGMEEEEPNLSNKTQLWIITNDAEIYGAVSVFYEEHLYSVAEKVGTNLYLLPSSIHEMLAISANKRSPQKLAEMVQHINQINVKKEDRLSNNIYYYDKTRRLLMLCTDSKRGLEDCE